MSTEIVILVEDMRLHGYLDDSPTAQALADALPIDGRAQLWGEEIYFPVDRVVAELDETATVVVHVGDLGYWPTSRAFCIFFGPTPESVPGEIRPASAVNRVGRITDDPCCLKLVKEGAPVRIERRKKKKSLSELESMGYGSLSSDSGMQPQSFEDLGMQPQGVEDLGRPGIAPGLPPTATALIDQILEKLDWGTIVFSVPETMNLKDTTLVQLALSLVKTVEELNQEITASGKIEWDKIRVANVMEARLTGQNFRITAITRELQAITGHDTTKWSWEIKPTKPGIATLHLTLNVKIKVEGVLTPRAIHTFDKYIEVNVTLGQKIGIFIRENWQWLFAAISGIAALLGWLWTQYHK